MWDIWWRLLRPHTLTAAFVPVFVGTALAFKYGPLNYLLFGAMMAASIIIQAATNMFNEYYDFKRGLDHAGSVGIGGTIVRDGIPAPVVFKLALGFFAVAALLGLYICIMSSWWIAAIGVVSMSMGYFYTGGPYPIASSPFGELFAGTFMGLVIIEIAFFIQTGIITTESILVSIPVSILCGAILTSNNIRDLKGDQENGRRTLAILLGHRRAVVFLALLFAAAYLWVAGMVLYDISSAWLLVVLVSLPKAIQAIKRFQGKVLAVEMVTAMKATAELHTIFGLLLAIGILLGIWLEI